MEYIIKYANGTCERITLTTSENIRRIIETDKRKVIGYVKVR